MKSAGPDYPSLSRRTLLAAGLAMPAVLDGLSSSAAAADGDGPRIGHIGVRNQGMGNLRALMAYTVAVCDVDSAVLARARAAVEAAGRPCAAFADYRRLLERQDVDAVVITTPDHWHAKIAIDAMRAGKDVYCEKPLTLTIREGRLIARVARETGRILQTGSQQRSDERFRRACELVRNGHLGRIREIRVGLPSPNFSGPPVPDATPPPELDYDFWLGPAPKRPYNENRVHYLFRFFWNYSGGQLTNFGAHHLDIVQWALGKDESGPIRAEGTARYHSEGWYETPEQFDVTYEYEGGIPVRCGQAYPQGVTFEGEHGTLSVNRGKLEARPAELLQASAPGDVRLAVSEDHHRNWLESIRTRRPPICSAEVGHRSATVCHLGNIAIRSGRPVRWDPVAEQVIGDAEQEAMTHYAYRAPWSLAP